MNDNPTEQGYSHAKAALRYLLRVSLDEIRGLAYPNLRAAEEQIRLAIAEAEAKQKELNEAKEQLRLTHIDWQTELGATEHAAERAERARQALSDIRRCIRNSRSAPNVLDTIDAIAVDALTKESSHER